MRVSVVLVFLALSACAANPNVAESSSPERSTPVSSAPASSVTPVQPASQNCREFSAPVKIGNEEKQLVGRACEQPDGTWQIVPTSSQTPRVIEQTNFYRYDDAWWGPWYGFGMFGFVGIHHHHW